MKNLNDNYWKTFPSLWSKWKCSKPSNTWGTERWLNFKSTGRLQETNVGISANLSNVSWRLTNLYNSNPRRSGALFLAFVGTRHTCSIQTDRCVDKTPICLKKLKIFLVRAEMHMTSDLEPSPWLCVISGYRVCHPGMGGCPALQPPVCSYHFTWDGRGYHFLFSTALHYRSRVLGKLGQKDWVWIFQPHLELLRRSCSGGGGH